MCTLYMYLYDCRPQLESGARKMSTIVLKLALLVLAILCVPDRCCGWDQAELDLFDLVEEVGENFYDILHVDQVRSISID